MSHNNTNIDQNFRLIFLLNFLFGMNNTNTKLMENNPLSKYSSLLFLLVILTLFVIFDRASLLSEGNLIVQVADILVSHTILTTFVVTVVIIYKNQKEIDQTFAKLIFIDQMLHVDQKPLKLFIRIQLLFTACIWSVFAVYYMIVTCVNDASLCVAYFVSHYVSLLSTHLLVVKLTSIMFMISLFFRELNARMLQIPNNPKQSYTLLTIRLLHQHLSDNSRVLIACFHVPLLLVSASALIGMFVAVFSSLFGYVLQGKMTPDGFTMYTVLPIILLCISLGQILVLVMVCDRFYAQVWQTGVLLHWICLFSADSGEFRRVAFDFSAQLLHDAFDVTGFGFFVINRALLQAMLGTIATYIIILMQFDSAIPKRLQKALSVTGTVSTKMVTE